MIRLVALVAFFCLPLVIGTAIAAPVVITQAIANAGGVTPGDGPGFPVTISQPGSYRLGSNLDVTAAKNGILVTTSDVTIDLDGFRISGGPAGGVATNAVTGILGQSDRLTVKNGTIGGFRNRGIDTFTHAYLVVENMRIVNNRYFGIYAPGFVARIQNNTVATNQGDGVLCGPGCHAEGNVISTNGDRGLAIRRGMALGNTIVSNGSFGILSLGLEIVGIGNNTLIDNNSGGPQIDGITVSLEPNACGNTTC